MNLLDYQERKFFYLFILHTLFYSLTDGELKEAEGLPEKFELSSLEPSAITKCCDQGSAFANRNTSNVHNLEACQQKTDVDSELCGTLFRSCCENRMHELSCDYGRKIASEHEPLEKRIWFLTKIKQIETPYCNSSGLQEKIQGQNLVNHAEKCCICHQVERQVLLEKSKPIQNILWTFCKRLSCCQERKIDEFILKSEAKKFYNRSTRDTMIKVNSTHPTCSDASFFWDENESMCVKMVVKCPRNMKMDKTTKKCVLRNNEEVQCPTGFQFDEELEECIDIDECKDTSLCQSSGMVCKNTEGSYACVCTNGFQKVNETTCHDIDECKLGKHNCTLGQSCMNTIGSFRCLRKVPCGYGYTLNEYTQECEDVDECVTGKTSCAIDEVCVNLRGSHTCKKETCKENKKRNQNGICSDCKQGFRKNMLNDICEDIDECIEEAVECKRNEKCVNLIGSYECSPKIDCPIGKIIDEEGTECLDIDECRTDKFDCKITEICINTDSSYTCIASPCGKAQMYNYEIEECVCLPGYKPNPFFKDQCIDINECIEREDKDELCPLTLACLNTQGSYNCISKSRCQAGFIRHSENEDCVDVDECKLNLHDCSKDMICENSPGSFKCECKRGFKFIQGKCVDIDECAYMDHETACGDKEARCVNNDGSYQCVCPIGKSYQGGSLKKCMDVNECAQNPTICGRQNKCVNTDGSYECVCGKGFKNGEDTRRCIDIDECKLMESGNSTIRNCQNALCINTIGSYKCECPPGYRLNKNLYCEDINECQETLGACPNRPQNMCINLQGSYRCVTDLCPEGYEKQFYINGFKCELTEDRICSDNVINCHQQYPIYTEKIYFELKSKLALPQILRRINPMKPKGSTSHLRADVREHYAYNFETKKPVPVRDAFKLQVSRTEPGKIELVLTKQLPSSIDILISVNIIQDNKILTDTRLYMFVSETISDRIKKMDTWRQQSIERYRRKSF